jgi:hypothetical protein
MLALLDAAPAHALEDGQKAWLKFPSSRRNPEHSAGDRCRPRHAGGRRGGKRWSIVANVTESRHRYFAIPDSQQGGARLRQDHRRSIFVDARSPPPRFEVTTELEIVVGSAHDPASRVHDDEKESFDERPGIHSGTRAKFCTVPNMQLPGPRVRFSEEDPQHGHPTPRSRRGPKPTPVRPSAGAVCRREDRFRSLRVSGVQDGARGRRGIHTSSPSPVALHDVQARVDKTPGHTLSDDDRK